MDYARILLNRHGVITTALAHEDGLSTKAVAHRVNSGRWQRLHPGVFLTNTGAITWEIRAAAALAKAGQPSVLAHFSALAVIGLAKKTRGLTIMVPNRSQVTVRGARIIRTRSLEGAFMDGLPVTPVSRSLIDVADLPRITMDEVISLCARACQQGSTTADKLLAELARRRQHARRADLRLALGDVADGIESLAEHRFLRRVARAHGLPTFTLQVRKALGRVDFDNEEFRVTIEVDGQLWHAGERFHTDRRRDRKTSAHGGVTVRATWWDVSQDPCDLAADLARIFTHRGWQGSPQPCGPRCHVARR
ncbi:type IV toxin-antitoxin system AbiEi family antitoxin domain-containing protein [Ornithinimicrobium cavernae]|uniref:type IV toxin-antitoxin system AbiEi family antitoxin domain-containing protein n=1 Tax=Ornithinimicrobium cavernae TaxID=2666047 RepID=UPI000D68B1FD|nr:type IV toxin-antitoxin system AbiEi family antitoxin domain-containing protein [Ornithinimicrobium cavernae]